MAISKRTFQSAGQISTHSIPGAYSRIDSVKGVGSLVSANNVVIMGQSTGGQPNTLLQFNSISEAVNSLKGGALMEAVRLAFNPGNDLNPQRVYAVRVNTATQSTYTMEDGSANDMIKIDSKDYGLSQNQITLALAAGTVTGKKVTVGYKTDTETFDDIEQQSLTVTHASATVTIENNSTTTEMTLSVGTITVDFATYPTIGDVAAYINQQTGYTATVVAGQENALSTELDGVTALTAVGGADLESSMQAIIDTINGGSNYITAEAINATNDIAIPAIFTTLYMTGGTAGTYSATEWTAALLTLESENVQFISTPDATAAVHAPIKTHCELMSAVSGRKERQFLVGGEWADTVATAVSASGVLNSKSGMYVYNGFTQRDVNAVVQNYPASYTACLLAGMCGAAAINAPLTFKTLNVIALENKLSNTSLESLIDNGVAPANYNSAQIPHVVRQVNTYQSDDLLYNEFSMVKEAYYVGRDLRAYLEDRFVGKPGNVLTGGVIKGAVEAKLIQYTDLGIFTKDSAGISYWNIVISISGDTVTVDYDAYLTAPVNFIFITNHFSTVVSTT